MMTVTNPRATQLAAMIGGKPLLGNKHELELGLGQPPDCYGGCDMQDEQLAMECDPSAKIVITEDAQLVMQLPIADQFINQALGQSIEPFAVPNGQPPNGFSSSTNTIQTGNLFPSNMIIRGLWIRILVDNEGRTIDGNLFNPGGVANLPMSPDVFTAIDVLNNVFGLAAGQGPLVPGELLYGFPAWKVAENVTKAYNLAWYEDENTALMRQPLLSVARVDPFGEASAAGFAFGSNLDRIKDFNDRMQGPALANPNVFLPITHQRYGSISVGATVGIGLFEPTRQADTAPTMFGGIGIPNAPMVEPFLFPCPMWWPRDKSFRLILELQNLQFQAIAQRWASVTGGVGGQPGNDLNLPISSLTGISGNAPATTGPDIALERTLDTPGVNITQQTPTNRAILKYGNLIFEFGIIGRRVKDVWLPAVARAVNKGAICVPVGGGALDWHIRNEAQKAGVTPQING
jgi:hypothetical protein